MLCRVGESVQRERGDARRRGPPLRLDQFLRAAVDLRDKHLLRRGERREQRQRARNEDRLKTRHYRSDVREEQVPDSVLEHGPPNSARGRPLTGLLTRRVKFTNLLALVTK